MTECCHWRLDNLGPRVTKPLCRGSSWTQHERVDPTRTQVVTELLERVQVGVGSEQAHVTALHQIGQALLQLLDSLVWVH